LERVEPLGGSQMLWRYLHLPSGCPVVVKFTTLTKEAKRELRILSRCQHRSLVALRGAYKNDDTLCVCLEYLELGSVADALELLGPPQEAVVCYWTGDLVEALEYLHDEIQAVHRNVRPSSLLLDGRGRLRLGDFGIATDATNAMTLVGTPMYMAPERVVGAPYGSPADVWAVGLCVCHCATGQKPYAGTCVWKLLQAVQESPPPSLPEGPVHPAAMRDLVGQCLRRDPADRPPCRVLRTHPWLLGFRSQDPREFDVTYQGWVAELAAKRRIRTQPPG